MRDFEETVRRLREVNDIISGLDAAIRAAAFELLRPYVEGVESDVPGGNGPTATTGSAVDGGVDSNSESESLREFLAKHRSDKPSENVFALAAFKYSRDGLAPFKARELQEVGTQGGCRRPSTHPQNPRGCLQGRETPVQTSRQGPVQAHSCGREVLAEGVRGQERPPAAG